MTLTDDALQSIAGDYTREAGVRSWSGDREGAAEGRGAGGAGEVTLPVTVDAGDLAGFLGHPRSPRIGRADRLPGVATGLAVTGTGGDVLFIEASLADPETGRPA